MVVETEEIVTLKELAYELGTTPKALRKWLRDHKIKKPGSRWEWLENDQRLEEIRQLRKGVKPGKPTKRKAEEKVKLLIKGNQKEIDRSYDRIFKIIDRHTTFFKVDTENEYQTEDGYVLEFKDIPQTAVFEILEKVKNVDEI